MKAMQLCKNLGGSVNVPKEPFDDIIDIDKHDNCNSFWVPIEYNETNKFWQDTNTKKEVEHLKWNTNL